MVSLLQEPKGCVPAPIYMLCDSHSRSAPFLNHLDKLTQRNHHTARA